MNNLNLEISEKLWNDADFQNAYNQIRIENQRISHGINGSLKDFPWENLISAAATLASVSEEYDSSGKFHTAALHISLIAFLAQDNISINVQPIFEFILSRLGHFPVLRLVEGRYADSLEKFIEDLAKKIPFHLQVEIEDHYTRNKIGNIVLTDLQTSLLNLLKDNNSQQISISAPTSAGKTFVLRYYLAEWFNSEENKIAIYVVPTRALISEVASDLRKSFLKFESDVEVSTVGLPPVSPDRKYLYVLTQERLLSLLSQISQLKNFKIGTLIVDEAQHIKDETRGPLLHQSIRWVLQEHLPSRVIFSSPVLKNANIFQDIIGASNSINRYIKKSKKSPVIQNIITVHRVMRKAKQLELKLLLDAETGTMNFIGTLERDKPWAQSTTEYLSQVAIELGKETQNIIYVDSPHLADLVAEKLIGSLEPTTNEVLIKASEFIKQSIHKDYSLSKSLKYGVAVHYGFMPSLVRETVEFLFKEGHIKYLVCTSTLAHGVNLPAQKLFMYEPKQTGADRCKHSASSDIFWNVAGRAGRLFNDFEGDVYLLHKLNEHWADQYLHDGKEIELITALENIVRFDSNAIAQHFANNVDMRDEKGNEIRGGEESANVFFECHLQHGSINPLLASNVAADLQTSSKLIDDGIEIAKTRITLDWYVTRSNAGISPLRQQQLYDIIKNTLLPESLLLPKTNIYNPSINSNEYRSILENVFVCLDPEYDPFKNAGYYTHLVILACQWMHGIPLKILIDKAVEFGRKEDPNRSVNPIVRDFLRKLDQWVRFKLVKFINCYHNLLKYHYNQIGRLDLIEKIPDNLPLYLEIGSCHPLQVALMKVGISRMTAIEISPYLDHIKNSHDIRGEILITEVAKLLNKQGVNLAEPYKRELLGLIH